MEGKHPEALEGEMFLTNTNEDNYLMISYRTKRAGSIAYSKYGEVLKGMFPVFVQFDEYEKRMMDAGLR